VVLLQAVGQLPQDCGAHEADIWILVEREADGGRSRHWNLRLLRRWDRSQQGAADRIVEFLGEAFRRRISDS
jgi:hypothetical protein